MTRKEADEQQVIVDYLMYLAGAGGVGFFFSSRRRHTRYWRDWSSDVCSSDLDGFQGDEHWARDVPATGDAAVRLLGADGLIGVLVDGEVQALAPEDGALRARL